MIGPVMGKRPIKKYIPILLFIMAFSGFLSTQILWDTYHLNAEQVDQDKQKYSVYESVFQGLKLTTTKSTSIVLKNIKEPIVLLNFWASWCVPCLKELPSLVKFQTKFQGRVKVIGINGDEEDPIEMVNKIEKKYKLNFESATDENSQISSKFLIGTYPISIIFHKGKVIYFSKTIHDFMDEKFLSLIESELKAN
jgi:thiol-disulfide isomerase/thioredoxin